MDNAQEKILKIDTLGRVRTSRERREAILSDFEQSGMSGAAYARLHGISYSTFANWVQKRRRRKPGNGSGPTAVEVREKMELTLAEVTVQEASSAGLRVELSCGASLVINNAKQAELAAGLIRQLASN